MSKYSMLAVCLCALTWAGTVQAGFLGNNLELQLLQTMINGDIHSETTSVSVNDPLGTSTTIGGIDVTIDDTTVQLQGAVTLPTSLNVVDLYDSLNPITAATGIGSGSVSSGVDGNGHQYVLISDLNNDIKSSVDVSFASPLLETASFNLVALDATVPEPGAFNLMALGLTILGIMTYQRKRVRA